ncbi:hypothetical protein P879_11243 [Paragonimus westermani]|uniref:Uncharacterized protein n=1 Tax=Paragonimus westermani TaxID=34504 RepID=A0A8T0D514_9TREM|nr:hypothetical protein P879_11243 [Paragonimus westermani]
MNKVILVLAVVVALICSTKATFNKHCVHRCNRDFGQCRNVCKMSLAQRRECLENCRTSLSTCLTGSCRED